MSKSNGFHTRAIRGQMDRTHYREHSSPVFLTSSFVFPDAQTMEATFRGEEEGIIYTRYANPNTDELIAKVCAMEKTEAGFATASGMAAVFASMAAFLQQGDHVLASRAVFGSTHQILTQLLPRWGITHTYVDPQQIDQWEQYIQPNTRMLVVESPSNPGLALVDLEKAGALAKAYDLLFNIDNCFATPYLQTPVDYGADLIVHSGTKWLDGQGRVLAGLICGTQEKIEQVQFFARHTGPALSPFHAWLLSKSLETLGVRMDRHCANALALAQQLQGQAGIRSVRYPFLTDHPQFELAKKQMRLGGGLITIDLEGGRQRSQAFLNALNMCSLSANLGDTRTILTHPATTTHAKLTPEERKIVGITEGMIRISVGLEEVSDIAEDILQALHRSAL